MNSRATKRSRRAGNEATKGGIPRAAAANRAFLRSHTARPPISTFRSRRAGISAFSLIEMMIAIVILGLGLIMVATIFPVAWTRARDLNEAATEQSLVAGAHPTVATLVRPGTVRQFFDPVSQSIIGERLVAGGLLGDLFYDPSVGAAPMAYSDTRVHALHMSNYKVAGGPGNPIDFVINEDPWALEQLTRYFDPNFEASLQQTLGLSSPFDPQIRLWQRVSPPMSAPPLGTDPTANAEWEDELSRRRFAWAVLYRIRHPIGPGAPAIPPTPARLAELQEEWRTAMGATRDLDMYYVTLRRPNPTNRYARQDASSTNSVPALITATNIANASAAEPKAMPAAEDLAFPVAWRVEVEVVAATGLSPKSAATGVPSEIQVPRQQSPPSATAAAMLVQMFPEGTRFVDEVSGQVYRVVKRRVTVDGSTAFLTLDRELFVEDLDYSDTNTTVSNGTVEPGEAVRTVWVFPPPVDRENSSSETTPAFGGATPVVNIDVRPLSLSPTS